MWKGAGVVGFETEKLITIGPTPGEFLYYRDLIPLIIYVLDMSVGCVVLLHPEFSAGRVVSSSESLPSRLARKEFIRSRVLLSRFIKALGRTPSRVGTFVLKDTDLEA